MNDKPETRQQLIRQVRKNGAMSLLLEFSVFAWSSQFAAKQLELFVQQMNGRVMGRLLFNTRRALPEAMMRSVSFYSRNALLTCGGLKVELVKRLLSYKGKMCKDGFSHAMSVVSQLHKFLGPTCVATLEAKCVWVNSVAFHPTAPLLATGSWDNTAKLWRLSSDNSSATCVVTLEGHSKYVSSVAFHPSAPLLATGSWDKTTKLWWLSSDNSSASCVATLEGHSDLVNSVAFHPTAPLLVTGSSDGTAKLWC